MFTEITRLFRAIVGTLDVTTFKLGGVQYKTKWPMAAFGAWEISNDGARTNGGGIVGDVTLTNAFGAFAKTFDASEGAGTWGNVSNSSARGGYTSSYQLFPDLPAQTDAVAFGAIVPFCEVAFVLSGAGTEAVYDAAGVIGWEYSDGVDSWASLTVAYNGGGVTDAPDDNGEYFAQQDGAMSFIPPSDWAIVALDGQTAYWIRAVVQTGKGANMTTSPILTGVEHDIVTPADGFTCPHAGTITDIRTINGNASLHSGSDVKFILMNFTTGEHSGELTWAQDKVQDSWSGLSLVINAGDVLAPIVTQEDSGNNDPTNVMLELGVTPS